MTDTSELIKTLQQQNLFEGAGVEYLEDLIEHCPRKTLEPGEVLLDPSQSNDQIYCVIKGKLSVHVSDLTSTPIAQLIPGQCVGEMSLIEETTPSAFVVAVEHSEVLCIDQDRLWLMVDRSPEVARNLLGVLSKRIRRDNQVLSESHGLLRHYERHAMTDSLTGLHNRHWMAEMFERNLKRCLHDDKPICLVMMDLDNLKEFNDEYGHLAGDHVLYSVAATLREHFRTTDLIVRYGGDEFAALLPETDLADATQVAERARLAIEEYNEDPNEQGAITASIGVAEWQSSENLEALLERADRALYNAKQKGRNQVSD